MGDAAATEPVAPGRRRGRPRGIVIPSNRWHVTIIMRRDREPPFALRMHDRLNGEITREVLRGLTIRQRGEAYAAATARQAVLNSGPAPMTMLSWDKARARVEKVIEGEKRPATLKAYRKSLGAFERYAEEILTCQPGPAGRRLQFVAQVSEAVAREFSAWRLREGVGNFTVNRDLRHLAAFWNEYLGKMDLATFNPWQRIKRQGVVHREVVRLTAAQLAALLRKTCDFGPKFHAAVALAAEVGPRVGELCHTTWRHVDTALCAWLITVEPCGWKPKGVAERLVRFSPETGRLLDRWRRAAVADLVAQGFGKADAVLLVDAGRVFGVGQCAGPDRWERNFNRDLQAACKAAKVPDVTCHGLRYTVGRLAADAGAAPTAVKDMLGHASIGTTMHYIGSGQAGGAVVAFEALQRAKSAVSMPRTQPASTRRRRKSSNRKGL